MDKFQLRERRILLIFLSLLALYFLTLWILSLGPEAEPRWVEARVVRIGGKPDRLHLNNVVLVARTADGLVGQAQVLPSKLKCSVGDTIQAELIGVTLRPDETSCAPPAGEPDERI